jgi:hypothetical protein
MRIHSTMPPHETLNSLLATCRLDRTVNPQVLLRLWARAGLHSMPWAAAVHMDNQRSAVGRSENHITRDRTLRSCWALLVKVHQLETGLRLYIQCHDLASVLLVISASSLDLMMRLAVSGVTRRPLMALVKPLTVAGMSKMVRNANMVHTLRRRILSRVIRIKVPKTWRDNEASIV